MSATTPDLTDSVALVTGATSGLGRRFAEVLAAHGAAVAVAGRRTERAQEVVEAIESAGGRAIAVRLDVCDAVAIPAALDEVEDRLGLVDVLVNNAGIPDAQRAHRMSLELVDDVLATNVRGPWLLSTTVAGRLIDAARPGRIVNVSSMASFQYGGEGAALYSVTKAAINRMTEALAVEWARHEINVTAIAPGAFASEMMDGMLARMGDITSGFPRGRLGDPSQLDSTLLFLVSPASTAVTGTVVKVDDGQMPR